MTGLPVAQTTGYTAMFFRAAPTSPRPLGERSRVELPCTAAARLVSAAAAAAETAARQTSQVAPRGLPYGRGRLGMAGSC